MSGAKRSGKSSKLATGGRVVVVVAGGPPGTVPRLHPASEPLLLANDLAAVRGDGCFETLLLTGGVPAKSDRHLQRLRNSSTQLGIDGPTDDQWRTAIAMAATAWGAQSEGMLRLVLSRGVEHGDTPTAYITVAPVPDAALRARAEGIDVLTMQRGFSIDLAAKAPWQLLGAKTLSYATNMAALRYATDHGCHDALFLSAEGDVLEGPRSTLVIVRDGEIVSPPGSIGILEGTTLAALSDVALQTGIKTRRERLTVTDLLAADGVWMLSSVTLAARIRTLDGSAVSSGPTSVDVPALVDQAVGRQHASE